MAAIEGKESQSDSSVQADDPDEYSTLRRLQAIHDARERVIETQKSVDNAQIDGHPGITPRKASGALKRAVEMYIRELMPLLKADKIQDDHGLEVDYWNSIDLGSVDLPNGETWEFEGLKSLIEQEGVKTVEWVEEASSPEVGTERMTRSTEVVIPRRIVMAAFDAANQFVADVGLDLELIADNKVAEADYSDILD